MATREELKPLMGTVAKAYINGVGTKIMLLAVGDEVATLKVLSGDGICYRPAEVIRINVIELPTD